MSHLQSKLDTASLRWTSNIPKKACKQCSEAKRRCSLERPICSRCESRKLNCQYYAANTPGPFVGKASTSAFTHQPFAEVGSAGSLEIDMTSAQIQHVGTGEATLDFTNIHLVPITDSAQIGNRWMGSFIPIPHQRPKSFQLFTVQYLSCVLQTYHKSMLCPGGLPPIIHPLQIVNEQLSKPLANCYTLVHQWEEHDSGTVVSLSIQQEMNRLLEEYHSYGHLELLAAFQAYLLYTLMEIASHVSATGLLCDAEISRTRLNGSPGLLLLPRGERFMLCISSVTYLIQSARSQYILQRSYQPFQFHAASYYGMLEKETSGNKSMIIIFRHGTMVSSRFQNCGCLPKPVLPNGERGSRNGYSQ